MDIIEQSIYAIICQHDGIKAKQIAAKLKKERSLVNHYLHTSPYMQELCYQDREYQWHSFIRQTIPHTGLSDFSGYYSTVLEFIEMPKEEWFDTLLSGCKQIGRNLNDTRGLFHSFEDTAETMRVLFEDLEHQAFEDWEILFELRIKKARYIRIYADVLVITNDKVFSLEFKMNDKIEQEEIKQASKYTEYLEVLFGPKYDVIPVLVLTKAKDLYRYIQMEGTTAEIPVCSGDVLFNIFDEYLE